MSNSFAAWEGCYDCSGQAMPGARALLAWLLKAYPSTSSLGIYNCRNVRGGTSMSIHACGRAVDLKVPMINNRGTPLGHSIVNQLAAEGKRLGIQAIIYDREIWSARSPDGRYYGGTAPHYDHIHIELNKNAGSKLNLATLYAVLGEGEEMLQQGAKGDSVALYQKAILNWAQRTGKLEGVTPNKDGGLWERALHWGPDGDFGGTTVEMVEAYQRAADLEVTGSIGGVTAANLIRYVLPKQESKLETHDHDEAYAPKTHKHKLVGTAE